MSEYEAAEREMDHMQAEIDQLRAGLDNVYADSARLDKLERLLKAHGMGRAFLQDIFAKDLRAAIDAVEEAKP